MTGSSAEPEDDPINIWGPSPRPRRGLARRLVSVIGLATVVVAALGVGAHFIGPVSMVVTVLASFAPLFALLALVAALLLALARCWIMAVAAMLVAAVGIAVELPLYIGERSVAEAGAPKVRLLQANLYFGEADARTLVDRVRSDGVDVLTVAELTDGAVGKLAAAGIDQVLPYSYLRPTRGSASGGGIYSRLPLAETAELSGLEHSSLRATINPPGGAPFAVYALHPMPPYPVPTWWWAHELDRIGVILAAEPLPLVAGGDMNSTYDHERYRQLLKNGGRAGAPLVDASEFLGSGIVPTYPANTWYPALLAIDRILTRGVTPLSFERVDLPGSDHYGVVGDVQLAESADR